MLSLLSFVSCAAYLIVPVDRRTVDAEAAGGLSGLFAALGILFLFIGKIRESW